MRARAGGELEKEERRKAILAQADELFRDRSFDEITMSDLAAAIGLAKGTLYLYFPSKESLFLALLGDRLEAAFAELFARLEGELARGPVSAEGVASCTAEVMAADPALPRLLALMYTVLEARLPFEEAAAFKRGLASSVEEAGRRLALALPGLAPEEGRKYFIFLYAQVVGLVGLTDLSPFMRRIGSMPGLEVFRLGFEDTLRESARALLAGLSMARAGEARGEGGEA